jgi:hypothetical protein
MVLVSINYKYHTRNQHLLRLRLVQKTTTAVTTRLRKRPEIHQDLPQHQMDFFQLQSRFLGKQIRMGTRPGKHTKNLGKITIV